MLYQYWTTKSVKVLIQAAEKLGVEKHPATDQHHPFSEVLKYFTIICLNYDQKYILNCVQPFVTFEHNLYAESPVNLFKRNLNLKLYYSPQTVTVTGNKFAVASRHPAEIIYWTW